MRTIDRSSYTPAVRGLVDTALGNQRPSTLVFGEPVSTVREPLNGLKEARGTDAWKAGLWLWFDFMDECHAIAQDLDTPSGSYWHAIVHRREPDAANARYWCNRLGAHPIFPELLADARELGHGVPQLRPLLDARQWQPALFVDLCTSRAAPPMTEALLAIQRREIELLFDLDWCESSR
jgi:hypothetical protein